TSITTSPGPGDGSATSRTARRPGCSRMTCFISKRTEIALDAVHAALDHFHRGRVRDAEVIPAAEVVAADDADFRTFEEPQRKAVAVSDAGFGEHVAAVDEDVERSARNRDRQAVDRADALADVVAPLAELFDHWREQLLRARQGSGGSGLRDRARIGRRLALQRR